MHVKEVQQRVNICFTGCEQSAANVMPNLVSLTMSNGNASQVAVGDRILFTFTVGPLASASMHNPIPRVNHSYEYLQLSVRTTVARTIRLPTVPIYLIYITGRVLFITKRCLQNKSFEHNSHPHSQTHIYTSICIYTHSFNRSPLPDRS